MSQAVKILRHLNNGHSIDATHAVKAFGCVRLSAIIHALKSQGHDIESFWDYGRDGRRVKVYHL
jgi:hypothetical protein